MPTTVSGWAERVEKTMAARALESRASLMPKKPSVLWYMSSWKARAGRRLTKKIRIVPAKTR